jgi:hypothetical protein
MQWSELDRYGAHTYYVWLENLSSLHLAANGQFLAGLGVLH